MLALTLMELDFDLKLARVGHGFGEETYAHARLKQLAADGNEHLLVSSNMDMAAKVVAMSNSLKTVSKLDIHLLAEAKTNYHCRSGTLRTVYDLVTWFTRICATYNLKLRFNLIQC
jgi:hypothetical protein